MTHIPIQKVYNTLLSLSILVYTVQLKFLYYIALWYYMHDKHYTASFNNPKWQ